VKTFRKILALCFVLTLAVCASAAVKDFSLFSVDIPNNWIVQEANGAMSAAAPDGTMALSISCVEAPQGMSFDDYVKSLSAGVASAGAGEVTRGKDGSATWSMKQNGVEIRTTVFVKNNKFVSVSKTSANGEFGELDKASDSIKIK
jgi:uncharacterized lipoprotein YehR (DUF1307 family)